MTTQIRPATIDDIPAIQEVGRAAWQQTYTTLVSAEYVEQGIAQWWSPERLTALISDPLLVTRVAVAEGRVGGIAQLGFHQPPNAYLWKLYIHPDLQGRRTGALLLDSVIPQMPNSIKTIIADIVTGNERAGRFYLRYGFAHAGESEMQAFGVTVPLVRFQLQKTQDPI